MYFNLLAKRAASAQRVRHYSALQKKHQFVVILHDYQDSEALQRRLKVREQHLAGAKEAESEGAISHGGAILDNLESCKMKGSFLLVNGDSVEEVQEMITRDPYYHGKVWEKWDIYPVKLAIGANK